MTDDMTRILGDGWQLQIDDRIDVDERHELRHVVAHMLDGGCVLRLNDDLSTDDVERVVAAFDTQLVADDA